MSHQHTNQSPAKQPGLFSELDVEDNKHMLRIKNRYSKVLGTQMLCKHCDQLCTRRGGKQLYCKKCSGEIRRGKLQEWKENNPITTEQRRNSSAESRQQSKELGAAISELHGKKMADVFCDETGMAWVRRFEVRFSYAASKNHCFRNAYKKMRTYLRKEAKDYRSEVAYLVRSALQDVEVVTSKLWIGLLVQKPNHYGDAINVIDLIMDAIKEGSGLDDRWFCLKGLDWQIIKKNPKIFIGIGQESKVNCQICCYCGRALPFDQFWSHKGRHSKNGLSAGCKECMTCKQKV